MDKTINLINRFFDKNFKGRGVFAIPIDANVKKIFPFLFNKFLKIRFTSLLKKIVTQNNKNLCNIWNAWKLANITPDKKIYNISWCCCIWKTSILKIFKNW